MSFIATTAGDQGNDCALKGLPLYLGFENLGPGPGPQAGALAEQAFALLEAAKIPAARLVDQ